ncbi:carboxylating nicotinate-nucleotide diphosphorylase [Nocardioides zeae]|uniref:nicotinate-nucleotide diphosphorylase (carboxylating) n=1 Tax=Nocardioides imazamoxiresistens TaxID=3231893 RepID=A0ABU3PZM8_9ACTN|nr:carboxylating nicotinate-nucleotide diphosphorylase [Nocardioides zeae]MDT9594712.1 carboxylating nicotinate-nucleotide diphosphorylase [Nocardioides zeae]
MLARHPLDAMPPALLAELEVGGLVPADLYAAVVAAIDEDVPGEDVTSAATIPVDARGTADLAAREPGVVAGLALAELVFRYVLGDAVTVTERRPDGARVAAGDLVMRVEGPTRGLLTAERVALNYASHLSGVATATAAWVAALDGTRARVLDTRKTLPGMRALQKYAVRCGGGVNHRWSLSDVAMVKDNHVVAAGGVVPAYRAVRERDPDVRVVVEVTELAELEQLLDVGCPWVLLDNMDPATLRAAVAANEARGDGAAVLEASGGLTIERARAVAETGVDYISVGALTHSVTVFDLGLDLRDATP